MQAISGNDPQGELLRNYLSNLEQEVCGVSTGFNPNR